MATATCRAPHPHARVQAALGSPSRCAGACPRAAGAARADGWLLASLGPRLARDAPPAQGGHVRARLHSARGAALQRAAIGGASFFVSLGRVTAIAAVGAAAWRT